MDILSLLAIREVRVCVSVCICQESQCVGVSEAILVFKYLMSLPLKKQ